MIDDAGTKARMKIPLVGISQGLFMNMPDVLVDMMTSSFYNLGTRVKPWWEI